MSDFETGFPAPQTANDTVIESAPDTAEMRMSEEIDNTVPGYGYHTGTVVGLGGSAGSLSALRTFFENMPSDAGMTFVVVTHLAPDNISLMAEILQRSTSMQVVQVTENIKVQENWVYVIPPSKHLCMMNGHLELVDLEPDRGRRIAVDLFLRTLGDTHGPHAIGVILSGTDSDGAIGIKRIKERGGLTIAQEPGEAEQEGMPLSSISTGMVDWVLPVAEMPARILEYRRNEARLRLPAEESPVVPEDTAASEEADEKALREVLSFLRMRTNRDFTYYKRATILRRIGRRMQVHGLTSLSDYLALLRTHQGEPHTLLQDLLISVTNFFRDREAFSALQEMIPGLFAGKGAGDQVRVWVAGCATGEEAYSIGMLLMEYADDLKDSPSIQIFASDLDEHSLQEARTGSYPEAIAADVSEFRLRRFFHRDNGRLHVRTTLRERILFSVHDIFRDPPFSKLDLISCRNLFIYVNRETQRRAFDLFHFALNPHGCLFLGSAESADDVPALFSPINKKYRLYIRSGVPRPHPPLETKKPVLPPNLALPASMLHIRTAEAAEKSSLPMRHPTGAREFTSWRDLHFEFLDGVAPASVLINSDYEIVHFSEHAGKWLRSASGEPRNDLLEMVDPFLRANVRSVLFRAARDGGVVESLSTIAGSDSATQKTVRVRAHALAHIPGFFLVAFDGEGAAPSSFVRFQPVGEEATVRQLEEELRQTNHRLRDLEQQHRASLEELRAGNEELQSMNEELRSAGEELETGREELQSINEELQTINQELKARVEELGGSNNDLQNLMASTNIATIFLDRELRIKRYTPPAMALFNFIPSDLGRPLSDLANRLDYPKITAHAQAVLDTLVPVEENVRAGLGYFLARFQPYRTIEDRIGGVVITFVDITALKQAEQAALDSRANMRMVFENAREFAIFSMDTDRRITNWNSGAERLLGYMEAEILGLSGDIIFTPEDRALQAPQQEALTALSQGKSTDERWHLRRDGTRFWGSGAMMVMQDGEGNAMGLLKILRDQTEKQEALIELHQAKAAAETAANAKDRFLAVLSHELRTPLSPVMIEIESLLEDRETSGFQRESLEVISRNVRLEIQLIDDLLDVTRISSGKLEIKSESVDMHEVIQKTLAFCSADLLDKNHSVSVTLDAPHHLIVGDQLRLHQVLWNLVKNAAKFTPPNGQVWITTRNVDDFLIVEVGDNGKGLSSAASENLFDAFHQGNESVTRQYGGLGLGLAIAKAVVLAHGGSLHAESRGQGLGSVFTITLTLKGTPLSMAASDI